MPLPPMIPVYHQRIELAPYYVAGFLPQAAAVIEAFSTSSATVGTADITDALAAQLSIDFGCTSRWVADPAKLVDNGDGTFSWHTSAGDIPAAYWKFDAASVPTLDPAYSWTLRDGTEVDIPAFLFGGSVWGKLHGFPDDLPGYCVFVVARMRGSNGAGNGVIVASVVSGSDPDTATDVYMRMQGDYIRSGVKGHFVTDRILDTDRPHIAAMSQRDNLCRQFTADTDFSFVAFSHPDIAAYDMSWFLGRNGGTYDDSRTMVMDVVDILMWDTFQTRAQMHLIAHRLNGLYGVTG